MINPLTGFTMLSHTLQKKGAQVHSTTLPQIDKQQPLTATASKHNPSVLGKRGRIIPKASISTVEGESSQKVSAKRRLVNPKRSSGAIEARPPVTPGPSAIATPRLGREQQAFSFSMASPRSEPLLQEQSTPNQEYDNWMNENLMMAECDKSQFKYRTSVDKAERYGGPFQRYSREKISTHLAQFQDGVSYLTNEDYLNRFGRDSLGCPDNTLFVSPLIKTAYVLHSTAGDVPKIKELLGLSHWPDNSVVRVISINNPKKFYINLPSGSEWSANGEFELGGYTKKGIPEAVLQKKVPKGEYTEYSPEEFLAARRLACRSQ